MINKQILNRECSLETSWQTTSCQGIVEVTEIACQESQYLCCMSPCSILEEF